ncbi:MAG: GAP family protein [Acidimicrobiales bacterium]|jgi:threonine/homoserine/homoserine lactone efflux protein
MGQAIGDLIPYALGIATSPIAVIAVILMLFSKRGRTNSTSFLAGWTVAVVGACAVVLAFSRALQNRSRGGSSTTSLIIDVVLGVFLVLLAARSFQRRPKPGERVGLPKWLQAIDSLTPVKSALLGGLSPLGGGLNPTNLLLIAGAMVTLSQHHLAPGGDAVAILVFIIIGISTIGAPVVVYWCAGKRGQPLLDKTKAWLTQNNAVVTAALLFLIGCVLVVEGAHGLST